MKYNESIPFDPMWCSIIATDLTHTGGPRKRFVEEYESNLCYRRCAKDLIADGNFYGDSKGALDTLFGNKSSEGGKPPLTEEDIVRAESDFDKSDVERRNDLRQGTINPASYDDDAHKKAMENVLKTEGVLNNDEQVEGVKIGEDGSLHATAVKRDDRGRVASSREIKATNTGDGLGLTPDETPTSTMRVGNGGKSAIISNEKGTFKLEAQGKNDLGENVWKATQLTDADGNKISDIAPGADASQVFTVDADWDDDAQHKYTAEYISDKSGIVTIRAKSVSDSRANSVGYRGAMQGYSLSEGDGKRNLMNPDEVQHLGKEEILIMTNGQNLLKAKRFGFIHHPLFSDPHFVPTRWSELPKTVDLYPDARKHDALESLVGDIQRQKEVNTEIAQRRSEERMNPRMRKSDLIGNDKVPSKKNAFADKAKKK